jgi:hypothetical protein
VSARLDRLWWRLRGSPPRPWAAILLGAALMALVAYLVVRLTLLERSLVVGYGLLGGTAVGVVEERIDRALVHAAVTVAVAFVLQVALFVVDDLVVAARYGVVAPPMSLVPATLPSRVLVFAAFETYVAMLVVVPGAFGALLAAAAIPKARRLLSQERRPRG